MSDVRAHCNLSDEEYAARRQQLRAELVPQVRGRTELPDADGVALRFDASPELRAQLDDFVSFERECCPGLGFSVEETARGLHLEIRGVDPGARVFSEIAATAETAGPVGQLGSPRPDPEGQGERRGWLRLLRSVGLGGGLAFVLFCVLPLGIAAVVGAQVAAPLGALDNPWAVGIGGAAFAALLWRWERKRTAARASAATTGRCGC